jgi:ABC-type transporter Mla subunit MlaD
MTREQLQRAAESMHTAADAVAHVDEDAAQRLTDLAEQTDGLAEADRGPDHGRLARLLTALDEVKEGLDKGDAADAIDEAKAALTAYRETVDGV